MNILLVPLLPLAYLINFIWELYWRKRKPVKVSARVISVGNLMVGGTGKTTLAGFISERLLDQGARTALVARGYGRLRGAPGRIRGDSDTPWQDIGDEPAVLARAIPGLAIYVDSDKTQAARDAAAGGMEWIIVDDGFQHRKLYRDIDIVCLEGEKPFGNGLLLPAGKLREPSRALRRADILVAFDISDKKLTKLAFYGKPIFRARKKVMGVGTINGKEIDKVGIRGQKFVGFCGLGNPNSFEKSLREAKIDIVNFLKFRDHHIYNAADIDKIMGIVKNTGADGAITTAKDLVKLERLWPSDIGLFYLQISIELENKAEFLKLIGI